MYRAYLVGLGLVATMLLSLGSCGVMKRIDELREENDALRQERKAFSRFVACVDVQEGDVGGTVWQGASVA
jgi:hypothetical protein